MPLPFTHAQFLDVFGAYNAALWPVAAALWIATAVVAVQVLRRRADVRTLAALLAFHWAWSGVAYQLIYFAPINPAARIFAALFLVQAAAFAWYGLTRGRLAAAGSPTPFRIAGLVLIAASLAYPALSLLAGMAWPRAPLFAVPCPTTLFTAGVLLSAPPPVPQWLFAVPVLWAVIGGSAALALSVTPDLMLFGAALLMALRAAAQRSGG